MYLISEKIFSILISNENKLLDSILSSFTIYDVQVLASFTSCISIIHPIKGTDCISVNVNLLYSTKNITRKKKIITAGVTAGIILPGDIVDTKIFATQCTEEVDVKEFQIGFMLFAYHLGSDGMIILFMISLMVAKTILDHI